MNFRFTMTRNGHLQLFPSQIEPNQILPAILFFSIHNIIDIHKTNCLYKYSAKMVYSFGGEEGKGKVDCAGFINGTEKIL